MQRKEVNLEKKQETNKVTLFSIVLICLVAVFHSYIVSELFEIRKGVVASHKFATKEIANHERVEELLSFDELDENTTDSKNIFYNEISEQLIDTQSRTITKLGKTAKMSSYLILALAFLILLLKQVHLIIRIATFVSVIYFLYFKGIFMLH